MLKKVLTIFIIFISLLQFKCELPEASDIDPPIVALVYPANGTVLTGSVIVTVTATDDQEVSSVYYYFDGELMESQAASTASFELDLSPYEDNQTHFFQGGANDISGNKGLSAQIAVLISDRLDITPPQVEIISPSNGAFVSDSVKIVSTAADAQGISRVAFFVDGDSVYSDNSYPYEYMMYFNDIFIQEVRLVQSKGFDINGNWNLSSTITLNVLPSKDIEAPSIILLYPLAGTTIYGTVTVALDVTDNFGVERVEFYVDGGNNGEPHQVVINPPWNFQWNTLPWADGNQHTLFVKAFDAAENTGNAGPFTYTIQ